MQSRIFEKQAIVCLILYSMTFASAMDHETPVKDVIIEIADAQKFIASVDIKAAQKTGPAPKTKQAGDNAKIKKAKQLLDFSDNVLCHIFVCSIDETQNAAEFLKQLQRVYLFSPVCKKFKAIINSNAFARQLGKKFTINDMRIRKWITLAQEPRSWESCSPLHLALEQDKKQLIKTLVTAGADVSKTSGTYGPMHYVQSLEAFNFLQAAGIDVDQPRGSNNRGPLYFIAAKFGENHELTQKIMQLTKDDAQQATQQLNNAAQANAAGGPLVIQNPAAIRVARQRQCCIFVIFGFVLTGILTPAIIKALGY